MLLQLERRAEELTTRLKAMADKADWSDNERKQVDDDKAELQRVKDDLSNRQYIENIETRATAANKPAEKDWQRSIKDFRLTKLIAHELGDKVDAGLEREISAETAQRSGRPHTGLVVPTEILEQRVVSTTTPSGGAGGRIVDPDYRPEMFIPLLRDSLVMNQLGAQVLRGLSGGEVQIPKAKAGMIGGWATEQGDLTTDDLEFETPVTLSPKKVGVIGEYSKYMMLQASPDIEMLFRRDLSESLARTIDSVAIGGGGTNQPRGITSRVTASTQTGTSTNGKKALLADYYALAKSVDAANVPSTRRGWLINNNVRYAAAQQVKFPTAGSDTIYMNGQMLGEPTVVSELVPSNGTKGSATGSLSTAIYGNWSDLIIGFWSELEILLNPYVSSAYNKGNVQIRSLMVADIALRRSESFKFYEDIVTT